MSKPIHSQVQIAHYVSAYEAVSAYQKKHLLIAGVALITAVALGVLTYSILTKGLLPNQLSQVDHIAIAVAACTTTFHIALAGIFLHYVCNSTKKKRNANLAALLITLRDKTTAEIWNNPNTAANKKYIESFKKLMQTKFSNEKFKEMLLYLEETFFHQSSEPHSNSLIQSQVYTMLFEAAPAIFLKNYYELRTANKLEKCSAFLDAKLKEKISQFEDQDWKSLIDSIQPADAKILVSLVEDPLCIKAYEQLRSKTLLKALLLIDKAYVSQPSEHRKKIDNFFMHISSSKRTAIRFMKRYYKNLSLFSSALKSSLEIKIDDYLQSSLPAEDWAILIRRSDLSYTKLQKTTQNIIPRTLIEKMCAINLVRFQTAFAQAQRLTKLHDMDVGEMDSLTLYALTSLIQRQTDINERQAHAAGYN